MTYENCGLGAVAVHAGDRWGFVVSNAYDWKLVSLTYATEAQAKEAHD